MATLDIRSGPWDREAIEAFLRDTVIPIRLASAGRTSPLVQSLWFLYDEESLWCCTQREAVLTRRLIADPRCGFEVSGDLPPYRGVRGTATAEVLPERAADVLPRLIDRYLGDAPNQLANWLLSRLDREVAIRLHDLRLTSFDFTTRMS
ncbi:MAG: pyridoxamine 5'-phosphate oxidase family protein [Actinomycetota bacterium]